MLHFVAALLLGLGVNSFALGQEFPAKGPVHLIVGFAPGGGSDAIARALNTRMGEVLRQSVVVENRSGAGGSLAAEYVAKSAPDGYTVLFTLNNHSINQALYAKLPYDTERDLRGVTLIGSLVAGDRRLSRRRRQHAAAVPPARTEERCEAPRLRKRWRRLAGAFCRGLPRVPRGRGVHARSLSGAGPAVADVVGGQVPYILSTLSSLLPQIKAGRLKAIAVTSPERSALLPAVPTIAESGFPGYDMDSWMGTFVPRATPVAVMKVLHEATLDALKQPLVRERVEAQAGRVTPGSGEALDAIVAEDIKRYTKIVKERGIKAE